jgi:hypothetical protein
VSELNGHLAPRESDLAESRLDSLPAAIRCAFQSR